MATPRPRGSERERTAYHEAGHAVMAHEFGIRVKRVSIMADSETLGRMRREWERWTREIDHTITPYREAKLHRWIMVCLAGAAATAVHSNYTDWRGSGADRQRATELADHLTSGPEETQALLHWLWIRTRAALAHPLTWAKVDAVATALLSQQELAARQFCAVLEQATRDCITAIHAGSALEQ